MTYEARIIVHATDLSVYCILGWTLNNAIQSHIDIYLSQETFTGVKQAFPYLVAKEFASGGGDVIRFNPSRDLALMLEKPDS
jgi:hypothetical protein